MGKVFLTLSLMMLSVWSSAQTQQGYVKTKGRMVNGQYVKGQGIQGATVSVKGRNAVVSQNGGLFSFPVTANSFQILGVQKKGYELLDADAARKTYRYSPNPLYLVMETPEQQTQDRLDAERRLRRTLQRQLQKREDEIDAMQASLEEKQRLLQQLYQNQENNEKLIADMAQEYAMMDYDQMDSLNQRISDAIINGRLTEADSLLRSKGDINSRIAGIRREQEAETQREAEIARQQQELAASQEGTRKKLEDAASDCYKFFDRFRLANQHDSAAYYMELRASLDTTRAEWQYHAGKYLYAQRQYHKAEAYLTRALTLYRQLAEAQPDLYEPSLSQTLNDIGNLYSNTQRLQDCEVLYQEALNIRKRLAAVNPQEFDAEVGRTLLNIALLYSRTQRIKESEATNKEALDIFRRLAKDYPRKYNPDIAHTLHNLALLYMDNRRYEESETYYKEALELIRELAKDTPQVYEPEMAMTLNNLGLLYARTRRYAEGEAMFKEALDIRRKWAEVNPQANEPFVAQLLINLANLYAGNQHYDGCEAMYQEALDIRKRLATINQKAYESDVAATLSFMTSFYYHTKRFSDAVVVCSEALAVYRRLAAIQPQSYISNVITALVQLAYCNIFLGHYAEAEQYAREGLSIAPTQHWINSSIAGALLLQGKYAEAEAIYRQYKDELKDGLVADLQQFAEAGIIPKEREEDVKRIRHILEE